MPRSPSRAQCADNAGQRLPAHGRIEPLRGHTAERQHDLWLHQRDLTIQVLPAEPDFRRRRRTVTLPAMPGRAGKALGEARQVEVTVECALRKSSPCQPGLERLARRSPVRLTQGTRPRPGRLPYYHQALAGMSLENGIRRRDEPGNDTARAAGDFPLHASEFNLVPRGGVVSR